MFFFQHPTIFQTLLTTIIVFLATRLLFLKLRRSQRTHSAYAQRLSTSIGSILPSPTSSYVMALISFFIATTPSEFIAFVSVSHLAWLIILHRLQAIVAYLTLPVRPPPLPDPAHFVTSTIWPLAFWAYCLVIVRDIHFDSAITIIDMMSFYSLYHVTLRLFLQQHGFFMIWVVPPSLLPILALFGQWLDTTDQILCIGIACDLLLIWSYKFSLRIFQVMDTSAQRWSDHGLVFIRGAHRIIRVHPTRPYIPDIHDGFYLGCSLLWLALLRQVSASIPFQITTLCHRISSVSPWHDVMFQWLSRPLSLAISFHIDVGGGSPEPFISTFIYLSYIALFQLSLAVFTAIRHRTFFIIQSLGRHTLSSLSFCVRECVHYVYSIAIELLAMNRFAMALWLYCVIDIPSSIFEMLGSEPDNLTTLAMDLEALLDSTTDFEWSFHEDYDSSVLDSLTMPPKPLPRPFRVSCLTYLLHRIGLFRFSLASPSFVAWSDHPTFPDAYTSTVFFVPDAFSDEYRLMLDTFTQEADIPDPIHCLDLIVSSALELCPSSSVYNTFIERFNPATAGLQLLLAERMDRVLKRRQPNPSRPCVSVNLSHCRSGMIASSVDWCFPSIDASVFNSIGHGLSTPLIIDSGASCCITPHRDDFSTYGDSTVKVKDLSGTNHVAGEGMIKWLVKDRFGREVSLELKAYHMPTASVRLLSPQALFKSVQGSTGHQDITKYTIILPNDIVLEAPYGRANLPLLPLSNSVDGCLWSQCFGFSASDQDDWAQSITSAANQNLTNSQKELLLWHFKLSHASLSTVHDLCRQKQRRRVDLPSVQDFIKLRDGPILPCSFNVPNAVCHGLLCAACLAAKAKRRSPSVKPTLSKPAPEMLLKRGHLQPGDCISCDHYISPVKGRAIASSGYSSSRHGYDCGTIYVDHASGFIFVNHQTSTSAPDTIRGKMQLEHEAAAVNVKIKRYHSDNGVFSSSEFRSHCKMLDQKLTFSAVGAKFQNGVAERAIQTVCNMARANMIHATLCWPGRPFIDMWPLAMNYAAWVHNKLPISYDGATPEELWSKIKCPESHLPRAHVFGCPVYVLDPKLQDGHAIPKWNSKARQGIFVGFSPEHSTNVPLVLNPSTQHISPQFHVIFDDHFTTVPAFTTDSQRDDRFKTLFTLGRNERFVDPDDITSFDTPDGSPLLSDDWLTEDDLSLRSASRRFLQDRLVHNEQRPQCKVPDGASDDALSVDSEGAPSVSEGVSPAEPPPSVLSDESVAPPAVSEGALPTRRARSSTWKDGPARSRSAIAAGLTCLLASQQYAMQSAQDWSQPPPSVSNVGSYPRSHPPKRVHLAAINEAALLQGDWDTLGRDACDGLSLAHVGIFVPDLADDIGCYTITDVQPHLLQAKVKSSDADNPTWTQAMNSPHADKWWEATQVEMSTLEDDLDAWDLVIRTPDMHVLPCKWAFKLKRFPDGLAKKFKARLCIRGDRQREGIDYFETWAPVVQWTTVRMMMILATKLQLCSAQADITAAFVHARLTEDDKIYVKQPQGYIRFGPNGEELVLRMKRAVYGLKQSPRYFFQYLKSHLESPAIGLKQSTLDPCLFYGQKLVVLIYVDDLLLFSRDESEFDRLIDALKAADVSIRREGTAEGFLGVDIDRSMTPDGPQVKLLQTGLTQRIVAALGLCSAMSTKIDTPAEVGPLPKDDLGAPAHGQFNYPAVIGMLLYLTGHSRPDIAFAVHQCARYTFAPKRKHELALIRIGRYLKGTASEGLVMRPTDTPRLDCYPDADFAGLYGHENSQDPHCARSRTGYVILAFGCPVVWKSKLQTEIALSTMEAEYVALSTACKDLIPLIALVKELRLAVGLPPSVSTNLHCKVHEDNVGALTLANLEPQRMTPRSKHYAIKYHWFREHVADPSNRITIVKIDTANQLGDMFTKGLPKVTFVKLRRMLMGW